VLKSFSRFRVLFAGVAVVGALVASGVVTASVASPGRVLVLPGATESAVVTVEPTRVLDTRVPVGLPGKLVAATPRNLQITGSIATYFEPTQTTTFQQVVPAGATGVLMNVTAVSPTADGYLSVRPGNATGVPATAGLNFAPGQVIPNAVTVALPTTGAINLYYGAGSTGATMDVVIDIVGYTTNTGLIDIVNRVTTLETATTNTGLIDIVNRVTTLETASLETASPARVIWVADDNTGDHPSLSKALEAITDATSSNPYVIKIAPGTYTETANVVLKTYVDVEGSGQNTTTINCACSSNNFDASSAVISAGAITAEIRHLTINNTGGGSQSGGVYTEGVADGSFSMLHVTATATGSTFSYGVANHNSSSPSMNNVTATATGNAFINYGVYNDDLSSPSMNNVTATATDGTNSYGVLNNDSSPSMNNVTATATDGTNDNAGVYNIASSPSIRNSSLAVGAAGTGISSSVFNDGTSDTKLVYTELDGNVDGVNGVGFTCVGVYTTAFVALDENCAAVPTP
jgi:hypothetical protein